MRGAGLVQGLEIVNNKEERIPAANFTTEIMYALKMKQVLVGITGRDKNVILFTPPMCFTIENSRFDIKHFTPLSRHFHISGGLPNVLMKSCPR